MLLARMGIMRMLILLDDAWIVLLMAQSVCNKRVDAIVRKHLQYTQFSLVAFMGTEQMTLQALCDEVGFRQ